MIDDIDPFEAFRLPGQDVTHPATIAHRLMKHQVHQHLGDNEVRFGWLMRLDQKDKGGKMELGSVHAVKNMAQGAFKDLFMQLLAGMLGDLPEFVIVLDAGWWQQASDMQREALIWHELAHVRQALDKYGAPRFDKDGLPVWALVEHDITAFNSEVERYGAWTPDIAGFIKAATAAGA
jgi:hypothetical protein